jgi:hypothetical protein
MLATNPFAALHSAVLLRSCVLWSVNVPVAFICSVDPSCTVAADTAIDESTAGPTVSVAVPLTVPEVAVITAVPGAFDVTSPDALIVATLALPELHVTDAVMSWLDPSEYWPAALNCCVSPAAREGVPGVTLIELSVAAGGAVVVAPPPPPPEQAVIATASKRRKRIGRREPAEQVPDMFVHPGISFERRKQNTSQIALRHTTLVAPALLSVNEKLTSPAPLRR